MSEDWVIVPTGRNIMEPQELLLKNSSVTKPDGFPVGSVAYTADLAYMAMYDGTTWHQIGG